MSQGSSARENFAADEKHPPAAPLLHFNGARLVEELLSLCNPKITKPIAELIALEVEMELREQNPENVTAELVSELVRFKLEELGLIEIRSPRNQEAPPLPKKVSSLKTASGKAPAESPKNLPGKTMKATQPFAPSQPSLRFELKPVKSRPIREDLLWSEEGRKALDDLTSIGGENAPQKAEEFLERFSQKIAQGDAFYDATADLEAGSVHFYNEWATLSFLPGAALLRADLATQKSPGMMWGLSVKPKTENLYETLQTIESAQKESLALCLGLDLSESADAEILLLNLLKTTLEHGVRSSKAAPRQDLYLNLETLLKTGESTEDKDASVSSSFLQWLQKEENRSYFALSLGVSGRPFDPPSALTGSPEPALGGRDSLVRVLRQCLLAASTLRLFFLERSQEQDLTPQMRADRVPSPVSPSLLYSGQWVPSAALNLVAMVDDEDISWDRLRRAVRHAVHFLDNAIDFISYPSEASERITKSNRSLSLGVMGWADLLYILRIPYNSDEALDLASRLAQFIQEEAVAASSELAKTRGVFPNYIGSLWQKRGIPVRNAHLTSLLWDPVPSNIAQVAPGIEPHSILVAQAPGANGKAQYLVHPFLAEVAKQRNFSHEAVYRKIVESGSLQEVLEIPKDVRKVFVGAQDIEWEWHLRMANAFERHFDQGVTKFCPVPATLEEELLADMVQKAVDLNLKSLCLKRVGEAVPQKTSEEAQNLPAEKTEARQEEETTQTGLSPAAASAPETKSSRESSYLVPRLRPDRLTGSTYKVKTTCGNLYVTINDDPQGPFELFAQLGKSGGCTASQNEAVSRMITLAFRCGIDPREVFDQLHGISCSGAARGPETLPSCTDAIAQAICLHLGIDGNRMAPQKQMEAPAPAILPQPEEPTLKDERKSVETKDAPSGENHLSAESAPIAACADCGKPFKKLNGSWSCPECKEGH
ncbi:MAG: TSCPD domain-containing protein [bacterium]